MPPPAPSEVPEAIRDFIQEYDALLLSRHGAMTVGRDVMDAYNKMEKLEHTARVVLAAGFRDRCRLCPPRKSRNCGASRQSIRPGGELYLIMRLTHSAHARTELKKRNDIRTHAWAIIKVDPL